MEEEKYFKKKKSMRKQEQELRLPKHVGGAGGLLLFKKAPQKNLASDQ